MRGAGGATPPSARRRRGQERGLLGVSERCDLRQRGTGRLLRAYGRRGGATGNDPQQPPQRRRLRRVGGGDRGRGRTDSRRRQATASWRPTDATPTWTA